MIIAFKCVDPAGCSLGWIERLSDKHGINQRGSIGELPEFFPYLNGPFECPKLICEYVPFIHRLRHRIEAHICIAFTAYAVYKELERVLKEEKSSMSLKTANCKRNYA